MKDIYLIILSGLFASLVGILSYWFKTVHKEFKGLLKEITDYTAQLKELIVGIQTQIDKGIETDIQELKQDIKTLYGKSNRMDTDLAKVKKSK